MEAKLADQLLSSQEGEIVGNATARMHKYQSATTKNTNLYIFSGKERTK